MSVYIESKPNNLLLNFRPIQGFKVEKLPIKASTALQAGTALFVEIASGVPTGYLTNANGSPANGANFVGILGEDIVSGDEDYATAGKEKSVYVPCSTFHEAEFTVTAGTFTAVDVFKPVAISSNGRGLDVDTNGTGAVITKYLTTTRGVCRFNSTITALA